jgi:hypothetical protein
LEAGLKAKHASVWCIGGAEVAAELDAKRAIDQGVLLLLYRLMHSLRFVYTDFPFAFLRLSFGCSALKAIFSKSRFSRFSHRLGATFPAHFVTHGPNITLFTTSNEQ